jgi:hypothetical protein
MDLSWATGPKWGTYASGDIAYVPLIVSAAVVLVLILQTAGR